MVVLHVEHTNKEEHYTATHRYNNQSTVIIVTVGTSWLFGPLLASHPFVHAAVSQYNILSILSILSLV